MTDREMLELAAKASGIVQTGYVSEGQYHHAALLYDNEDDCSVHWTPLTDDGDALRLAVSLNIDVLQRVTVPAEVWAQAPMQRTIIEPIGRDRLAATRRAITRAAAEIGKQK